MNVRARSFMRRPDGATRPHQVRVSVRVWLPLQTPVAQVPPWFAAIEPLTLYVCVAPFPVPDAAESASVYVRPSTVPDVASSAIVYGRAVVQRMPKEPVALDVPAWNEV